MLPKKISVLAVGLLLTQFAASMESQGQIPHLLFGEREASLIRFADRVISNVHDASSRKDIETALNNLFPLGGDPSEAIVALQLGTAELGEGQTLRVTYYSNKIVVAFEEIFDGRLGWLRYEIVREKSATRGRALTFGFGQP